MTSEDRAEINRIVDAAMARLKASMILDPARVQAEIARRVAEAGPAIVEAAHRGREIYIPKHSDIPDPVD